MAKWGEGDARWIVEERPDSTNVNNWHWTERNATEFSKIKMKDLFMEIKNESDEGSWKVKEVKTLDGEATINNRKGKLIYFYEWNIKLEYAGTLSGSSTEHTGTIECSNLSDENDADDLDISVRCESDSKNDQALKDVVRKSAIKMMKEKCAQYMNDLRTEFSKGMILPTKDGKAMNAKARTCNQHVKEAMKTSYESNACPPHTKMNTRVKSVNVNIKETFQTDVSQIYNVLIKQECIAGFTRSEAVVDTRVGGTFSIMGGNITGKFLELVENEKIVQEWRLKEWPEGTVSHVVIELKPSDEGTSLSLVQTGVPDHDMARTKEGWKRYFFVPIKTTFGFGSQMF